MRLKSATPFKNHNAVKNGESKRRIETENRDKNDSATYLENGYDNDNDAMRPSSKHNKTLILCSRGIPHRQRHLMLDFCRLLPNHKKDNKFDSKSELHYLNDLCELNNCHHVLFFESRKFEDLYLWMSKSPQGPTIKFQVENIHTLNELHFSGNGSSGSRPILSFDASFDSMNNNLNNINTNNDGKSNPQFIERSLIKEMLIQIFGLPLGHKKITQSHYDRIYQFSILDDKIWFRHYQICHDDILHNDKIDETSKLIEIGPRFVLTPIRIFDGSFNGKTLYINDKYVSPNSIRAMMKSKTAHKYIQRQKLQEVKQVRIKESVLNNDPENLKEIFQ